VTTPGSFLERGQDFVKAFGVRVCALKQAFYLGLFGAGQIGSGGHERRRRQQQKARECEQGSSKQSQCPPVRPAYLVLTCKLLKLPALAVLDRPQNW
jgi:hypothetical protein